MKTVAGSNKSKTSQNLPRLDGCVLIWDDKTNLVCTGLASGIHFTIDLDTSKLFEAFDKSIAEPKNDLVIEKYYALLGHLPDAELAKLDRKQVDQRSVKLITDLIRISVTHDKPQTLAAFIHPQHLGGPELIPLCIAIDCRKEWAIKTILDCKPLGMTRLAKAVALIHVVELQLDWKEVGERIVSLPITDPCLEEDDEEKKKKKIEEFRDKVSSAVAANRAGTNFEHAVATFLSTGTFPDAVEGGWMGQGLVYEVCAEKRRAILSIMKKHLTASFR